MIRITKEEFIELKKRFPNVYVTITSKQKMHNRKNRYMEKNRAAMKWLQKYRMKGMNNSGRV